MGKMKLDETKATSKLEKYEKYLSLSIFHDFPIGISTREYTGNMMFLDHLKQILEN